MGSISGSSWINDGYFVQDGRGFHSIVRILGIARHRIKTKLNCVCVDRKQGCIFFLMSQWRGNWRIKFFGAEFVLWKSKVEKNLPKVHPQSLAIVQPKNSLILSFSMHSMLCHKGRLYRYRDYLEEYTSLTGRDTEQRWAWMSDRTRSTGTCPSPPITSTAFWEATSSQSRWHNEGTEVFSKSNSSSRSMSGLH